MGLFGKGNIVNVTHYEGIPNFGSKWAVAMELDEEKQILSFRARAFTNSNSVQLPINKITKAGFVNITDIEEQSKIGRAFVGGLLFGNAGAIVGALSAGEKKKIRTLYIINYVSNGETKSIVLQDNGGNLNFSKFQKKLDALIPKNEPKKHQGTITL